MKLLTTLSLFMIVPLTVACSNEDSQSIRKKMLKPIIEQQCQSELKASKVWQAASIFMDSSSQKHAQSKICECVGDSALNDVSNKDLLLASVDEETKNKVIHQAVMNSIKGCAKEILK